MTQLLKEKNINITSLLFLTILLIGILLALNLSNSTPNKPLIPGYKLVDTQFNDDSKTVELELDLSTLNHNNK